MNLIPSIICATGISIMSAGLAGLHPDFAGQINWVGGWIAGSLVSVALFRPVPK